MRGRRVCLRTRTFPASEELSGRRAASWLILHNAGKLSDLRSPPGNRLEALKGDRRGQHSVRINDQWRICFEWRDDGAHDVEIVDYHR